MTDDDDKRWAAFLLALPSAWVPVATAFSKACGVVDGSVEADGSWTLDLTFGLSELSKLVRSAPVTFTAVDVGQAWMLQQHLEFESGVHVCREARAVLCWHDHFAAGLSATLWVYASDERYEAALADARKAHAENYDEDDDGEADDDGGPSV